ncbi:MAG: hypothetical protein ACI8UD_002962 [Planctomycetota bacterium]|jgi:hypothetical protein
MTGYSEQYDVLFIHVPQTAGSSMEQAEFVSGAGHRPYWAISEEIRDQAGFSFGFVRNPYDRFVSIVTEGMYTVMRNNGEMPSDQEGREQLFERTKQLVTYAAATGDQKGPLALGSTTQWRVLGKESDPLPHLEGWAYPIHFVPQHFFLSKPGMTEVGVDMVGRFENLHDDWQQICDRLGVKSAMPHLRNVQADRRHSYADFYTPESKAVVRKLYARDFEVFGYDPE